MTQKTRTNISDVLDSLSEENIRLDNAIKKVLADPQILARILKYSVTEFSEYSIDEIMSFICSDIEVNETPINPGMSRLKSVTGLATEDIVPNEGMVVYDIIFSAICGGEKTKFIINIEAQNTSDVPNLGYHIENRMTYYGGRLISSQKGVEFINSNYDDIKKVRSIWILLGCEDNEEGIDEIAFSVENKSGNSRNYENLDILKFIVIRIRKADNVERSKNKLIEMLEDLLSDKDLEEKKKILTERHNIVMTQEMEGGLRSMGGFGAALAEKAIEKGLAQGIEQGLEQGLEQGREEGIEEGIEGVLKILSEEQNISPEVIKKIEEYKKECSKQ